jgi:hypothetical protein
MADLGGTIEVVRLRAFGFSAQRFRIFLDDVMVARLSNGDRISLTAAPGRHPLTVKARLAFSGTAQVDVAPGGTVLVWCAARAQWIRVGVESPDASET